MNKFPQEMGGPLAGLNFHEVFITSPSNVEFCRQLWVEENTSGIFLEFLRFVKQQLSDPVLKDEHEKRCQEYVLNRGESIPPYLARFKINCNPHAKC
jgi:hypothetical protein